MSENTKIEWATHSWNPWIGCTKVSPGCKFCYAEHSTPTRVARKAGRELWGKGQARQRTSAAYWKQPAKWNREAYKFAESALGYGTSTGMHEAARQRVFPSLCDWLDDEVPVEWLADLLKLIHDTPNLDWLLLTKRPENFFDRVGRCIDSERRMMWFDEGTPPRNIWIGTSVEDQTRADERIPELLKIPAKVRFLSVEPMLGPVDLKLSKRWCSRTENAHDCDTIATHLHWVIIGGESGPGARPCNVEWIRDLVRQCKAAAVATFVKQLGKLPYVELGEEKLAMEFQGPKGGDMRIWPEDLRVREFPV